MCRGQSRAGSTGLRRRLDTAGSIADEAACGRSLPKSSLAMPSKTQVESAHSLDTAAWTPLERELLEGSGGRYDPRSMASRRRLPQGLGVATGAGCRTEVRGRVSMVTPTMSSRQRYHEALWACFVAQDCEDKELVVLETYESSPSAFLQQKAAEDHRLVHVCIKVKAGEDFSVGLKRNMTLHLASGEYIVNFDDDDLYAGCYASTMVREMQARSLVGVTLSAWYNYYSLTGDCTYSDPSSWGEWASSQEELDAILFGYGFSYAHRRHVSLEAPYPNVRFAEDAPFFLGLRSTYGDDRVGLLRDDRGICMHIMHRANSAQVLGTCDVDDEDLDELVIAQLAPLRHYRALALEAASDEAGLLEQLLAEALALLAGGLPGAGAKLQL